MYARRETLGGKDGLDPNHPPTQHRGGAPERYGWNSGAGLPSNGVLGGFALHRRPDGVAALIARMF